MGDLGKSRGEHIVSSRPAMGVPTTRRRSSGGDRVKRGTLKIEYRLHMKLHELNFMRTVGAILWIIVTFIIWQDQQFTLISDQPDLTMQMSS